MTKRSRKSRARHRERDAGRQATLQAKPKQEVAEPDKSVTSPKQTAASKPQEVAGQEWQRMGHLGSDIRRSFICGAVALTALVMLYILLR